MHHLSRRTATLALSLVVTVASIAVLTGPAQGAVSAWPGGQSVLAVDVSGDLGDNISGLAYVPSGTAAPGTMYAVRNDPSQLGLIMKSGDTWTRTSQWSLRYFGGTGAPDVEGVTVTAAGAAGGIYVVAERNGTGSSQPMVLRYTPGAPGVITPGAPGV